MHIPLKKKIEQCSANIFQMLLNERNEQGVWDGELSGSALANAVAVYGLWKYDATKNKHTIKQGLLWLKNNSNHDGGFGDTIKSKSNLSTSLLCWSAFSIVQNNDGFTDCINNVEHYIISQTGSIEPEALSKAILKHYANDKTFSVPILAMCALAGRLGENGWKYVPQLPYQFAVLPPGLFRWLKLNVVSYAIPALISMGLVKQKKTPSKNPLLRIINKGLEQNILKVLDSKQPDNGGFLEAIPLTAFVLMTLIEAGFKNNRVCNKAEKFLQQTVRSNYSWPIDVSLTTWVSTLAINAMNNNQLEEFRTLDQNKTLDWLMSQQHKTIHPFTNAAPGGWAWINTPGGVADGDDTSGALIALKRLSTINKDSIQSALMGLNWLMGIQNSDGGFPTFCKGWGKLPFDASCPDITAHAIRAMLEWINELDEANAKKTGQSINKAIAYLKKTQKNIGSWLPLWFGNELNKDHTNPVYGTALVVYGLLYAQEKGFNKLESCIDKGISFLMDCKNTNGSWGGNKNIEGSVEETSLAIKALCKAGQTKKINDSLNWLCKKVEQNNFESEPIGLYFASLWYYEALYPKVFALAALNCD